MKSYTVNIEQDPKSGELLLPFPQELLKQMGWSEGIELWWIDNKNGTYTIKEKSSSIDNEIDTDVGC